MDLMYELVMAFLVLCSIQVSTEDLLSTHPFQQQSAARSNNYTLTHHLGADQCKYSLITELRAAQLV